MLGVERWAFSHTSTETHHVGCAVFALHKCFLAATAAELATIGQWPRVDAGDSVSPAPDPPKEKENTANTWTAGV